MADESSQRQQHARRKQACNGCRQRKKKCDSRRPSCAPCRKWNVVCEYGPRLETHGVATVSTDEVDDDRRTEDVIGANGHSTFGNEEFAALADMPSLEQALELVDIFTGMFYRMLPCFHQASLREAFANEEIQVQAPVLAYAIFSMAAPYHADPAIQCQTVSWYTNAKLSYDLTQYQGEPALRVLQAAVCIIFYAFTIMDSSTTWLFLGKAWRQACATGLNRIDSDIGPLVGHMPRVTSPLVREEQRRTMWMLFILDRGCSCNVGYPHAIDERLFVVNLPSPDSMFHYNIPVEGSNMSLPLTADVDKLVLALTNQFVPRGLFQQIAVVYAVLGRVSSHVHVPATPNDTEKYNREFVGLQCLVEYIRCHLPLGAGTNIQSPDERFQSSWLQIVLHAASMLLNGPHVQSPPIMHPSVVTRTAEEAGAESMRRSRCQLATASIIGFLRKEISSMPERESLANPHLATGISLCAYLLLVDWLETEDLTTRSDIDVALAAFEFLRQRFPILAQKFISGIQFGLTYFKQAGLKPPGLRGMLAFCSLDSKTALVQA